MSTRGKKDILIFTVASVVALLACVLFSIRQENEIWFTENDIWQDVRFLVGTDTDAYTQFGKSESDDDVMRVYVSASDARVTFQHISAVRIGDLTYHNGDRLAGYVSSGETLNVALLDSTGKVLDERMVQFYLTTGVAALYLHIVTGDIDEIALDKGLEGNLHYEVVDASGNVDSVGAGTIRARGNANHATLKRSYSLNLENATAILGMGTASKWALRGMPDDVSMLMDKIVLDTSKAVGIPYAVDSKHVNLYVDGEYKGLYLLAQRVNADGGAVTTSDGSLMEFEFQMRYDAAEQKFQTKNRLVVVHSPKNMDQTSLEELHDYVQEAEDAIYSNNGVNAETGKTWFEYLDAESWIKDYWIQEFYINYDADYTSAFATQNADDNYLYAGPCWDFDRAFWYTYYNGDNQSHLLTVKGRLVPSWMQELDKKSDFHAARVQYYLNSFRDAVSLIEEEIPDLVDKIGPSLLMTYDRYGWDIDESYVEGLAEQYKDWIDTRLAFYDDYMANEDEYVLLYLDVPTDEVHGIVFAFRKGEAITFNTDVYGVTEWLYDDGKEFCNGDAIYEDTTLLSANTEIEQEHVSEYFIPGR